MPFTIIRIGCLLVAALSPLLTFAALWQVKEWRVDRLVEHLRAEGFWRQIFGVVRPAILIIGLLGNFLAPTTVLAADGTLLALTVLSVVQIALKKQRYPTWTGKALILVTTGLLITAITGYILLLFFIPTGGYILSALVLLQPGVLMDAWCLFWPVDTAMKAKIMKQAAALRATYINATAIGITGSVGKTTAKELVAHLLQSDTTLCTPAYVNSEMGVAKWLLKELPKHDPAAPLTLVVEMGAYRSGEIKKLCHIAQPSIGIITYIGTQHIALFGGQEKLLNAKAELIESLPKSGTALLNADNTFYEKLQQKTEAQVVAVGTGGHADLEAFDIQETATGIAFSVDQVMVHVPLHGTHNVTNVLLAIAAAQQLNMPMKQIAARLKNFNPPSQTFAVKEQCGVTVVDDTHNASPESFRAAIAWAKAQPGTHKVLLTPGLIELGKTEGRIHKELGEQANGIFDRIICSTPRAKQLLGAGYTGDISLYAKKTPRLAKGDLLVCVGRVSPATIAALLP